jgi:aspartyl-tRNA(Asn)/glutamyl-tRNA(Gln) amidotransferase subunit A
MAERLDAAGHLVEEVDPSWPSDTSEEALMPLQLAGLAAIYGARWQRQPWDADPEIARQIEMGLAMDARRVTSALEFRKQLYSVLDRFFRDHDLLLTPTTPVTAWPHGQSGPSHIEGRPVSARGHAVFTPLFNHCYMPACSVPCGLDAQGLPIGIQIIGPMYSDARVLALASWVERLCEHDFSQIQTPEGVGRYVSRGKPFEPVSAPSKQ